MKYKPYPKYKDSGVEWLGEIPEGWECKRLRFLAKLNPSKSELSNSHPDEVSFLPMDSIGDDGTLRLDITKAWEDVESGYTYFAEGDVAYAIITPCFENGKGAQMLGLKNKTGFGTTELCVLRPNKECDGKWLWYATISAPFRKIGESWMYGAGGQKRVPDDFARNFVIGFPSLCVQRTIASFLDAETERIAGLIKDYEDLIKLLKEKRQALISHAVTRGLSEIVGPDDPEFGEWAKPAKFKDSGVEWIGAIPEGWRAAPLKYFTRIGNGSTPNRDNPEYWAEDGFPWLNSSVVNKLEVTEASEFVTEIALNECHLPIISPPAVLVGITGQGKTRGMAAPLAFRATINQHLAYIMPNETEIAVGFLLRLLECAYEQLRFDSEGAGSTKGAITCEQLGKFPVPLPCISEQLVIASFLDQKTAKIDTLVSDSESAIKLLNEHRSALITSAVTGKINIEGATVHEARFPAMQPERSL